ncbi:MAG TPA: PaaI family thioesterase [Elusimicrobiales bacterium]|nr:PaaI family thioesterase [Elusimicrobiales bacterium]
MKKHLAWIREYFRKSSRTDVLENFLGLRITKLAKGRCECAMKAVERHGNIYGTVHGGTLAAVADFAMGVACVTAGKRVVTIDMSVSYLKGAPARTRLRAEGEVICAGRRLMRAEGRIYGGGELLARSQASYYVTGEFTAADHPLRPQRASKPGRRRAGKKCLASARLPGGPHRS